MFRVRTPPEVETFLMYLLSNWDVPNFSSHVFSGTLWEYDPTGEKILDDPSVLTREWEKQREHCSTRTKAKIVWEHDPLQLT